MSSAIIDELKTFGPDRCEPLSYAQADAYTQRLAKSHYENFTVVSWLLPKRLRDDFRHVYSFCRWADDLGDEVGDKQESLRLLDWWQSELELCYKGKPRHPVFVALLPTIQKYDIPQKPFSDLIAAFVQDQHMSRYQTWEQVLDYCTRSADPVGRLVLYMCGYRDEERQRLSDATCTALQLANFWQDVRRDVLERDRIYIPSEIASKHGLDLDFMVKTIQRDATCETENAAQGKSGSCCGSCKMPSVGASAILPAYRATLKELVERTWPLFNEGHRLFPLVASDVRIDIQLFSLGGESILRMIQKNRFDTLQSRPSLGKAAKMSLMFKAVTGKLLSSFAKDHAA